MLARNSALKLSTKLGLCLIKVLHAREKKREREREREREKKKERARERGPARAERTEEKEKDMPCAVSDLPSSNEAVLTAKSTEEEKRNPGRPQEKKGGRRRKRRGERNGSGNSGPKNPQKPRGVLSPKAVDQGIQTEKHSPRKHANTLTELGPKNPPRTRP